MYDGEDKMLASIHTQILHTIPEILAQIALAFLVVSGAVCFLAIRKSR